ncbi:MAG TPA: transporter [Rhizomicrobium sp.]|jgi:hypothetical protein|nr:transporter [Rhizomicrobium sp.]
MRFSPARVFALTLFFSLFGRGAIAEEARQSPDDAWWTGPLVTYSAKSLPQGHALIEPYLYDVSTRDSDTVHSFTYFLYGLTDKLTVGIAPDFAWTSMKNGRDSSGPHLGDVTLRAQYSLVQMDAEKGVPDIALAVLQNLPTGKYDRLGRASDGFGAGGYATTLAVYSQMLWWMPTGRLLRTRLDIMETFSPDVPVKDASVYGTSTGFLGRAAPGNQFSAEIGLEYSLTRQWVLASDLFYIHSDPTVTAGVQGTLPVTLNSGNSDIFGYAPAIEYNWTPNIGVIAGVRVFAPAHNAKAAVTPAIALNYVL